MELPVKILLEIIKYLLVVLAAILLGNGAVYFFNKMPAQWFLDYGEEPDPESPLADPYTQRIKSHPWKIIFTMFFVIVGIWMAADDFRFAIAACLSIWLLIEMAIGDALYQIVPDQLVLLLAVTALGYIPYFDGWRHSLFGALVGFGLIGTVALVGRLAYRRNTVGGGDVKLFMSLGLIAGPIGIIEIFTISTFLSVFHFLYLLARHRVQRVESRPMVPYITPAAIIFMVLLWGRAEILLEL